MTKEGDLSFPEPAKPTGDGPHYKGYINVQIPRPPVQDVAARIYYPAEFDGSMAPVNTSASTSCG